MGALSAQPRVRDTIPVCGLQPLQRMAVTKLKRAVFIFFTSTCSYVILFQIFITISKSCCSIGAGLLMASLSLYQKHQLIFLWIRARDYRCWWRLRGAVGSPGAGANGWLATQHGCRDFT